MHEPHKLGCIFGCNDDDILSHYLICPVLWSFANQFIKGEDSVFVSERMCFQNPSIDKLQRLAMAHAIYHACKKDHNCVEGPWIASPLQVQGKALGVARDVRHIVKCSHTVNSSSVSSAVTTASVHRATRRNVQNRG